MRASHVALTVFALVAPALLPSIARSERPNVLLLVAEDLSPRIGAYGDGVAATPNLDALARAGTLYTRAFTTAGVCAPSRAALVTGQHQISFGAQHMRTSTGPLGPYLARPPAEVRAFPELLRAAGYYTFTDGKLDYQFSGIRAGSGPFTMWNAEGADDYGWREREPDQPFFGLVNFIETHESGVFRPSGEPHSETHERTQAFRAPFAADAVTDPASVELPPYYPDLPVVRADVARHYDNIAAMDARVGRILRALERDGLAERTVVIWTADHGDGLPRAKRELYDAGIRVPMLVRNPLTAREAPEDDRLISFVDLAPTILALAGIAPPGYLHGENFLVENHARDYVFASRDRIDEVPDRQRAVRDERFKYIRSWHPEVPGGHPLAYRDNIDMVRAWRAEHEAGRLDPVQARWFEGAGDEQLYDTRVDPHEIVDVAGDPRYQAVKTRLKAALDEFLARVGDWGAQPEAEMRASLLSGGAIPVTPPARIDWLDGRATLTSPVHASIGYRLDGESQWRLYTGPVQARAFGFKSVRYGWLESQVTSARRPD